MDDIVIAALKKWPNVPACQGWLGLDARGQWYLRDAAVQAAGPFPQVKGDLIEHDKLRAFIERNYACDAQGAWFFQNGPQRVYVELELAPWVLRVQRCEGASPAFAVQTHTGLPVAQVTATWLDEAGHLYLSTEHGLGLVHSLDMHAAADALEAECWPAPDPTDQRDIPLQQGFQLSPAAALAASTLA